MALRITFTKRALRQFNRLDIRTAEKIRAAMERYAANPRGATGVKRLKGGSELRLRVGDYRVIFGNDGLIMTIYRVGHRKDIYR